VTLDEIAANDHVLTPGSFVGAVESGEDAEPVADRIARLTKQLFAQFEESSRLETVVREQLGRLDA
jgi:type I restriction enzyme M protein